MTLFDCNTSESAYPNLDAAAAKIPSLPKTLRYEDDYTGIVRSIDTASDIWQLHVDGSNRNVNWSSLPPAAKLVMQFWFVWGANVYDATRLLTFATFISKNSARIAGFLENLLRDPASANEFWHSTLITAGWHEGELVAAKTILRCFCLNFVGPWTPNYLDSVRQWPLGVRAGNPSFSDTLENVLSHPEEAGFLDYVDEIASNAALLEDIENAALRSVCILICCYQFGARPIQIASLDTADVRIRTSRQAKHPVVHIRFAQAKQRRGQIRQSMLRKVKDEWAGLFAHYTDRRHQSPALFVTELDRPNSYFGLRPGAITQLVIETSQAILGRSASANVYRHTAAQRLVDSGASEIELAEFLGHSDISSGLTYFDGAPSQAARINAALGLSPIYSKVSGVLSGAISLADLNFLPDEKKVAAAPHGILIAGIGGCNIGQPSCSKNPALSCYTCSKFMPLRDAKVHKVVRDELRPVISEFHNASRDSALSPTFMQLRLTMEAIEEVIAGLEATDNA